MPVSELANVAIAAVNKVGIVPMAGFRFDGVSCCACCC